MVPTPESSDTIYDSAVIGAGQAGLAASYYLQQRGISHVIFDANEQAGGAWSHRWNSLTMADVHGVANLPGTPAPAASTERANTVIPRYFMLYEKAHALPVIRPVRIEKVSEDPNSPELLLLTSPQGTWRARTIINATGTWARPFVPHYPGMQDFKGPHFHTASYPGADYFRGKTVLVIGAGASAVQFIGELAGLAQDILWATRNPPLWRDSNSIDGLEAVTRVEERTVRGEAPSSVVSSTGLVLRPQELKAQQMGFFDRRLPMPCKFIEDGALWAPQDVTAFDALTAEHLTFDAVLWATGFRPAIDHLAPLKLRSTRGGIQLRRVAKKVQAATTAVADERVNFVGYGPSASTVGASRAAREAARSVALYLKKNSR